MYIFMHYDQSILKGGYLCGKMISPYGKLSSTLQKKKKILRREEGREGGGREGERERGQGKGQLSKL